MNITNYIIVAALIVFFAWKWFKGWKIKRQLPLLIQAGAILVDVRSPVEFEAGHASGSINLPLASIQEGAKHLDRSKPVVLCCASGTRSAMAARILKKSGFEVVINGGSWRNLIQK
jgi:phage shock protein E